MKYKIPILVGNVDLEDDATLEAIGGQLSDLVWVETDGRVLATLHVEATDPVAAVVETAHRIRATLPESIVESIDLDLVGSPAEDQLDGTVGMAGKATRMTWRELATVLGERMRNHAYCPDHARSEADPDNCPFCNDRAAFDAYALKRRNG